MRDRHFIADFRRARLPGGFVMNGGQLLAQPHIEVAAEFDIGAATGHVGGDHHRTRRSGLRHDLGFLLVEAGVQHRVGHFPLLQQVADRLALFDRGGADENRLALGARFVDQCCDRLVFLGGGPIDLVVLVLAGDRDVGGNFDHIELVDFGELVGLCHRRAGHAGQLGIESKIVLEGDRGQGLVFRLDGNVFLRFQRLVQAFRVAAALHHAAGELVDDDHLILADYVIDIAGEQRMGTHGLLDVVHDRDVEDVVQITLGEDAGFLQHILDAFATGFGQRNCLEFFILVVSGGILHQLLHHDVDLAVQIRTVLGGAGDDQRRAGFIDQDGVDLVNDRVEEIALDHIFQAVFHVVAQVVEAELVVGAVGDVGGVLHPLGVLVLAMDDHAVGQAEEIVDLPHPVGVTPSEVVVNRDDMNALAGECVQIDGQRGDQGLALPGLHFRDFTVVQHHAADELHVEMPLSERAAAGLPDHGEGFREQVVERRAIGKPGAKLQVFAAKASSDSAFMPSSRALIAGTRR